ncbi:hypothetical protein TKK_0007285 [Trichogramma kaykai]|uniref:PAP-associated domain-containing protein n=1 Tax=Trichogramma kaykai TaxID=54128 RepID=A0ABD2X912_9HYME
MYQSNFSPHAMVHIVGNYQASNGQFISLPSHAFFTGSPTNIHQEFIQFPRNSSNHNSAVRQRVTQPGYPIELIHHFHIDPHNPVRNVHMATTSSSWSQRLNSPGRIPNTPQRINIPSSINLAPVHTRPNHQFRSISVGPAKKHTWNNNNNNNKNNNNKINKRHSYHDLPLLRESCNQSDSGVSSRSPTPNKHHKGNNPDDSPDDRESVTSVPEGKYRKNRTLESNNNSEGSLVSSISFSNLFQESTEPSDKAQKTNTNANSQSHPLNNTNNQNRRKYIAGRTTPATAPKSQRSKKYNVPTNEVHAYNRFYFNPADKYLERSHLVQVQEPPPQLLTGSPYDKLSEAIWKKFEENQLTRSTFCHKMYLWRYLYFYIKQRFPQYGLFMVGSTLNGFGTNASDVDMCLLVRDANPIDPRNEAIYRLGQIMSCLRKSDFIGHLQLIQAKVPILKIRDNVYNLEVDLNFNNVVGIRNTHLLHCYSRIDWRVRPLVLVIKSWAQCQNINDARHMTISSYSLVLMVIHFLQCGASPAVLPCLHSLYKTKFHPMSDIHSIDFHEELHLPSHSLNPRNTQTLGELLIDFFKYYDSFDFEKYAISVRVANKVPIDTCRYARAIKNDPHQWKYLCVEEPFDLTNTARSVYDLNVFEKIKEVFKQTHQQLEKTKDLNSIFSKIEAEP